MNIIRVGAILLSLSLSCTFLPVNSKQISKQISCKNSIKRDLLKIEDLMVEFELVFRRNPNRRDDMSEKTQIAFQIRDVLGRLRKDKSCYGQIKHIMASVWTTTREFDYAFFVHSYDIGEFDKSEWYSIKDNSVELCKGELIIND